MSDEIAFKSHLPEYRIWKGVKARCLSKTNRSYEDYGGRGIKICDRWKDSFENFYTDMGPRPSRQHSIDREDNDGDYEPNNCRWATRVEQANNQRSNVVFELPEGRFTLAQLARKVGLPQNTLRTRLYILKMSLEEAISRPIEKPKLYEMDGESLKASEWAERHSVDVSTLNRKLRSGLSIKEALEVIKKAQTYTFNGETLELTEWSKKTGYPVTTLKSRIKFGWPLEKVFTVPPGPDKYEYEGEMLSIKEISERIDIKYATIMGRLRKGMSFDEAVSTPV